MASGVSQQRAFSLNGDLLPTARDLVSDTDRWQELEYRCAKMERANMRIAHIDLNVTGSDIQYSFVVDEDADAHFRPEAADLDSSTQNSVPEDPLAAQLQIDPPLGQLLDRPTAQLQKDLLPSQLQNDPLPAQLQDCLPAQLLRAVSVQASRVASQGQECSLSSMAKSTSLPQVPADLEKPHMADLKVADPAILRYFSAVEDMMAMADDWDGLGASATQSSLMSRGTSVSSLHPSFPHSLLSPVSFASLHGPSQNSLLHVEAPRLGAQVGESKGMDAPSCLQADEGPLGGMTPLGSGSRPQRPRVTQLSMDREEGSELRRPGWQSGASCHAVQSPPWRKPEALRLGGNCNELRPTNFSDSRSRSGRKLLRTFFKF